ncbi:hypothetical protein FSP39_007757 [Pinctada imbricata]|uniref:G-protein coupled receptors family 2 profile 2 domain-containing protein n=1 Tax=Pinctada imbricata TaxID=66713 RepID=A0AA89BWR0_PINIB|nr:hypothetical protein FSP39_007757 [Pinctada imbricata]
MYFLYSRSLTKTGILPTIIYFVFYAIWNLSDYVDALNGYIQFQTFDETKEEDKKKHILSMLEDAEVQKDQYTIWDLDITCPTYLDFSHYVKLGDLLPVARRQNCRILYKTNVKESDVCDQRPYNDCNESPDWSYTDTDVQWSCKNTVNFPSFFSPAIPDIYPNIDVPWRNKTQRPESLFLYQNVFCALCSPLRYFSIDPVDTCNVTGMARPSDLRDSMDMKCQQSPFIYYYYPFKNHFCVLCNGIPIMSAAEGSIPSDIQQYDRAPGITWYPLLRNLFSIEQDNAIMEDVRVQDSPVCMKDQFFDFTEERCRNLTCFAGKFLQGEECQPLLKITNNLRYSLRLLVSAIPHHQQRAVDLLPIGVSHVGDYLMTSLFDEVVFISHTSVKGNQSCENTTDLSTPLFFELYVELFFVRSVFRHELEIKILNINQGSLSGTDVFSSIEFITDTNQSRLFRQSTESCMLAFPTHPRAFAMNTDRYYVAKISDVLLCPQVEISNEEYNISDDQSQITLLKLGVEVDRRQFDVTSDGQMRLCYEYLSSLKYFGQNAATRKEGVLVVPEPSLKYLWIVSLICSITSIVGLLLGLVVYCLFPVLRTTPGKLMISLMVSLFLTLLFQSLSFFMISTDVGCKIVGVVSHLTWLSVFTSMQVCNFHMYKVFSSNKPVRSNQTTRCFNKTILLYMLYILCVPILIVILNMVLSKTISHNSLFGYGGAKCFMDNTVSVISAFLCPVLLICISNILLYFLTIRIIHYTPNPAGNEQHRNELTIFTRLATITGISWIFQVIDSFLPLTFFSYIAAAVNSLQGLFVFIAFVVNKRTAVLMKAKFFRKDHRHTANTSKSASSTTANRSGTNSSMTTITKL